MGDALWRWDAVDLAQGIRTRRISSREATEACLARMEAVNGKLNAVTVPMPEQALAAADAADAAVKRGDVLGPLHGVPVTMKENVDQAGCATANGVVAYKDLIADTDSAPVANWKAAGAVILGRTNAPAFSLRWDTDNDLRGRTFNPWSRGHTPGGSSGGAAAAAAAGIGPLAHGNDYGGSVRYPAYCCGLAGIRPSFGRVPAYNPTVQGERPMTAQLMSVQGPLARKVRDVRIGLAAMARRDARDPWFVPAPMNGPPAARPIRVALCADPSGLGVHPAVAEAVKIAGEALADAGYAVEMVEPPSIGEAAVLWRRLVATDIRMLQWKTIQDLGDEGARRSVGFMTGAEPPLDLEGYMKGLAERSRHVRDWTLFLDRYPIVLTPVSTEPPFAIGFDTDSAESMDRTMTAQRVQTAVPLIGMPAAVVPVGSTDGLPLGVHLIGPRFREDLILDAAEVIEARHGLDTPIDPAW